MNNALFVRQFFAFFRPLRNYNRNSKQLQLLKHFLKFFLLSIDCIKLIYLYSICDCKIVRNLISKEKKKQTSQCDE